MKRARFVLITWLVVSGCAARQSASYTATDADEYATDDDQPAAQPEAPPEAGPPGDTADLSRPLSGCPGPAEDFGPVQLTAEAAGDRWGQGITAVADVRSSQAVPIEVCGVEGELQWLVALTCPDGSRPFSSMGHAHGSRAGSVGAGGRCEKIIDLYEVPCPDQGYEVYLDMYQCGPGESFM